MRESIEAQKDFNNALLKYTKKKSEDKKGEPLSDWEKSLIKEAFHFGWVSASNLCKQIIKEV